MDVVVKVSDTIKGLDVVDANALKAIEFATTQVGEVARDSMKNLIKGGHKMGTPTPSRPNTPPTNVTGKLRGSISTSVKRGFGNSYIATVGPGVHYARNLELGMGRYNTKYPFVAPTAKIMLSNGRARSVYVNALRYALSK